MSDDIIDDLHAAEDHIGVLEQAIEDLLAAGTFEPGATDRARSLLGSYERPSCDEDCDNEFCGSPRHNTQVWDDVADVWVDDEQTCPHDPDGQHHFGCGCDYQSPDDDPPPGLINCDRCGETVLAHLVATHQQLHCHGASVEPGQCSFRFASGGCCTEPAGHEQQPTPSGHVELIAPLRVCRDETCPECGWFETYGEAGSAGFEGGPVAVGCSRCGWREAL
ncbi:hypothetical protein [Desertimonas flava]|uniref:hypothetical protein n=1 Tax=Desertimonas flava TaxID=2064846 RepID=UPI000E348C46|nr:hypothetical protein [Desertimonas flava]